MSEIRLERIKDVVGRDADVFIDTTEGTQIVMGTKKTPSADIAPAALGAITGTTGTFTGVVSVSKTKTGATASVERLIRSELTLTPATSLAMSPATDSLASIRGGLTLTTGKSFTAGYLYGVQGKVTLDGATVAVGSAHIAGVYAQMSGNGTTVTNGHVAVIIASGQNLPTSANVNMIYAESGGGTVNAILQANVKCTYAFDITNFESCGVISTPAGKVASGNLRAIKVQLDGAAYYILASATLGT